METGADKQELKHGLRRALLARRDALDADYRHKTALAVAGKAKDLLALVGDEKLGSGFFAGYWPIRSEIDPRPLLSLLRDQGAKLCLPAVLDREKIEFRVFSPDAELAEGGFGTFAPDEKAQVVVPEIMLMPLVGFDRRGHRLGYGAGYYDRALAGFMEAGKKPLLIGMAFDCQQVDHIPNEAHDIALDCILTESGLRSFEAGL